MSNDTFCEIAHNYFLTLLVCSLDEAENVSVPLAEILFPSIKTPFTDDRDIPVISLVKWTTLYVIQVVGVCLLS